MKLLHVALFALALSFLQVGCVGYIDDDLASAPFYYVSPYKMASGAGFYRGGYVPGPYVRPGYWGNYYFLPAYWRDLNLRPAYYRAPYSRPAYYRGGSASWGGGCGSWHR
jgi:hypothetical protein